MALTVGPTMAARGPNKVGIQGELGILELVSMHNLIPNKIFLRLEHITDRYTAVVQFDDELFAKQLYPLLLSNIGRSIKEIGNLDVSHLL